MNDQVLIFSTSDNSTNVQVRFEHDTVWLSQKQMADLFDKNMMTINEHIKNVFSEGELDENSTLRKFLIVQNEGNRNVKREIIHYNLDVIISVGYRVRSKKGTEFRKWATQRLNDYLIRGYALNIEKIRRNETRFLKTLEDLKSLTTSNFKVETKDILSLIQTFSGTFFALDSYDKNEFPSHGTREEVQFTAQELQNDLIELKKQLISKGEATDLFGQEKKDGALKGIFASVFQTVFGEDAYPTIEEKAAHLLYFIVKNHPFNDGNKRSGAFSFIWFLQKTGFNFMGKISPETLTTLTILIAESNPIDKNKMIGIVQLLLNSRITNTNQN